MINYAGADITVEFDRASMDPGGVSTDYEFEMCREYVLDAVRDAFPGAVVRAARQGGRTSGVMSDGTDITRKVRDLVQNAYDHWCSFGGCSV